MFRFLDSACKIHKYLKIVIDKSVIKFEEIIDTSKTETINLNYKYATYIIG